MEIDITSPVELTNALLQNMPVKRFFTEKFFGEEVHGTETIGVDIVKGTQKLAPYIGKLSEADTSIRDNFTTKHFPTYNIALKRPTNAIDMFKRAPGGNITYVGGPSDPSERAVALLQRDQAELANMVNRTIEKYAADALLNGEVVIKDATGTTLDTISFGRSASHTVSVGSITAWDNGSAKIVKNIDDWAGLVAQDAGITATDIILGSDAANVFLEDSKVAKVLDTRNLNSGVVDLNLKANGGARFLGYIGGLRVWRYDEVWNNNGVITPIMPAKKVLVIGDAIRATVHYGLINDVKGGQFATKMFSKTWEQDDPSIQWLLVRSAPLPVVEQADGVVCATVLS